MPSWHRLLFIIHRAAICAIIELASLRILMRDPRSTFVLPIREAIDGWQPCSVRPCDGADPRGCAAKKLGRGAETGRARAPGISCRRRRALLCRGGTVQYRQIPAGPTDLRGAAR